MKMKDKRFIHGFSFAGISRHVFLSGWISQGKIIILAVFQIQWKAMYFFLYDAILVILFILLFLEIFAPLWLFAPRPFVRGQNGEAVGGANEATQSKGSYRRLLRLPHGSMRLSKWKSSLPCWHLHNVNWLGIKKSTVTKLPCLPHESYPKCYP